MNESIDRLLEQANLSPPPDTLDDAFYNWLEEAREKLDASFVSRTPLATEDLGELVRMLGSPAPELRSHYARSTPWDYELSDYTVRMERIRVECTSRLATQPGGSQGQAESEVSSAPPLWPVEVFTSGASALAFVDADDRLAIISADLRGGFGLGRPLAIGLRNYFAMRVITDLIWSSCDDDSSFVDVGLRPDVLEIGGWPSTNPPQHVLITCFALTNF